MILGKKYWYFLFLLMLIGNGIIFHGCEKNDENNSKTVTVISDALLDGYIENTTPRIVNNYASGSQGKEIRVGWNYEGYSMRGFLSFDISYILPADDSELVVEKAELLVHEANTNLHPFDGDGVNRTVDVYLVDYGSSLDASDYNNPGISSCGTIASWGYNVLNEHDLLVSTELQQIIDTRPQLKMIQFRLQFSNDDNISNPSSSDLDGSMWNIFSGDEDDYDEGTTDFRPKLVITYHLEKK